MPRFGNAFDFATEHMTVEARTGRRIGQPMEPTGMLRMTDAEARRLAESCSWTFAKTMPSIPHWYIIRDRDLGREEFNALARHVREHGRVGHWGVQPRKAFMKDGTVVDGLIYWEAGGYRYWLMGYPLEEETIINRERVERKGIRWADEEE